MAKIDYIIERYQRDWEEILTGTLNPSGGIGSNTLEVGHIITPNMEGTAGKSALFGYDSSPLRLTVDDEDKLKNFNPDYLYFVSDYDKVGNVVTVSGLRLCPVKEWEELEICFDDEYIIKRSKKKNKDPDKLARELTEDYIFDFGDRKLVFRQSYPNSNDFQMFGTNGYETIIRYREEKNKYFIHQDKRHDFPQDYQMFLQKMECLSLRTASICEESAAKIAHQEILSEIQKGTALIKIWGTYSDLELQKSMKLKEDVGGIPYRILISTPDFTRVQCELSQEKKDVFYAHFDELKNSAMEVENLKLQNEDGKRPSFNIKELDLRSERIDFYDEDNLMPSEGRLIIATKGDEMVKSRRERAVRKLQDTPDVLMRNILLAMEDKAEAMVSRSKNQPIKPIISGQTSKYLKEKFGIDKLTTNQEEAVRIALNTPDIAVIQGPPGTGKSTVIAAICNRLIEEAEKKNKDVNDKIILVSAFQNDTVEHIASKIETMGLPTIKAGKDTQGNIRGEDELIRSIRDRIDDAIHRLPPDKDMARVSQQLVVIRDILNSEHDYTAAKKDIEAIIEANKGRLSDTLWASWKAMYPPVKIQDSDKQIKALKGLLTTAAVYSDGGYERIVRLRQVGGIDFTDKEIELLDNAPFSDEEPSETFLTALNELKEKYLSALYAEKNETGDATRMDLQEWLDKAIRYFNELEQSSYEDEEVFLISVLRSLREDLEGNNAGIRDAIKNYGESLAATNQVAGGKELSKFKDIQNVILEEAARSNPLDLLIPMTKATRRVILVGDQKQLPHLLENDIVDDAVAYIDDDAKKADIAMKYEESLFNIFYNSLNKVKMPVRCIMLKEQFRMHPAIGDFISRLYYEGELVPGMGWEKQEKAKQHGLQLSWAKDKVAVFCNVPATAGREHPGKSKYRKAEAKRIVRLLDELKEDPAFDNLSIGIITFYSKQVEVIFEEASHHGYTIQNKDGSYSIAPDYLETKDHEEKLRIGTVDSFQGKEFDIVILSTVRSNEIERIDDNNLKVFGFLTLFNRLNVAFSRAKKMIIVAGDGDMFKDEYAKRHTEGLYEFYNNFSTDEKYGTRI